MDHNSTDHRTRAASALVLILMIYLTLIFFALLIAISGPIDEGQEWSQLVTAGILRGAV